MASINPTSQETNSDPAMPQTSAAAEPAASKRKPRKNASLTITVQVKKPKKIEVPARHKN